MLCIMYHLQPPPADEAGGDLFGFDEEDDDSDGDDPIEHPGSIPYRSYDTHIQMYAFKHAFIHTCMHTYIIHT